MKALGFIETYGLLPAIEAADAMLKAAEVRLLDKSLATGGLVTITVTGDVAAVKAAVDAGVASVGRIQGARIVSKHVIARPDASIDKIIKKLPGQTLCGCGCTDASTEAKGTAGASGDVAGNTSAHTVAEQIPSQQGGATSSGIPSATMPSDKVADTESDSALGSTPNNTLGNASDNTSGKTPAGKKPAGKRSPKKKK